MVSALRPYLPTALFAGLIVYFGFQAFTGEQGLLGWEKRNDLLAQRQAELKLVSAQRNDLESRARLLRDDHLSADLLEERARSLLGFADPRDYVIRIRQG
jgi:cell division protein FtsB